MYQESFSSETAYSGVVTPMSAVWLCPKFNSYKFLHLSLFSDTLLMIQSKLNIQARRLNSL